MYKVANFVLSICENEIAVMKEKNNSVIGNFIQQSYFELLKQANGHFTSNARSFSPSKNASSLSPMLTAPTPTGVPV